jgi:hypothetical protein
MSKMNDLLSLIDGHNRKVENLFELPVPIKELASDVPKETPLPLHEALKQMESLIDLACDKLHVTTERLNGINNY